MDSYAAIVIGGTGAVGGALMSELLASPNCASVVALVRRPVAQFDGLPGRDKLRVQQVELDDLEPATADLGSGCSVAFNTMGIGQARKVSRETLRRVEVTYAGDFARGAAAAGVRHISLLTSVGANAKSRSWYLAVKGDAERVVEDAGIERVTFFRPSLLVTREIRYGLQDRITQAVFPLVSPLLPGRYREITVEDLGRAMRANAERVGSGREILHYADFRSLLGQDAH